MSAGIGGGGPNQAAFETIAQTIASQFTQVEGPQGPQATLSQDQISSAAGKAAAALVEMAAPRLSSPDGDNSAGWSSFQDTLRQIIEQILTEQIKDRPVIEEGEQVAAASRGNDPDLAGQAATVNAILNAVGGTSAQSLAEFVGGVSDQLAQSLFFTQDAVQTEAMRQQVPDTA